LRDLSKVDIRVGRIVEAWPHPESDKLYCEKIDIGNGEIREIASGLQKHYTLEQMQNQMVVVITNLKGRKLAGFMSSGMVLCAQTADGEVVEFLRPPEGSEAGDHVSFEGYERKPLDVLPAKKNPWDNVFPNLVTDANQVGCYNDNGKMLPFTTPKGVCIATSVKNGLVK
jgi:aminoacyl tRNA synthase complex-interacting multifunctional protein 1